ncbi:MAG: methionyl-tRNA formyltransferase [Clostridia bacterium]|nr:methionyl-tRNA formyltransferase [Clostridia bacterium]
MRIVFMGTPDFAIPSLKALIDSGENVVGVICQPDRPKGRGHKLMACPVKETAVAAGIPVYQPEKIKAPEGVEKLKEFAPDLCVTAAFGQLLSAENLAVPRLGTINVHASLLPKHRGSAPINWSILMGDTVTGVTTMMTDIGMDTGDILLKKEIPIEKTDTAGTLTDRLAELGAQLLLETLAALKAGTLTRIRQDSELASTEPKLSREQGRIDFTMSSDAIDRRVRGLSPWPGTFTSLGGETMKVGKVAAVQMEGRPGEILVADPMKGLIVGCGQGAVELVEIQMPGSRMMNARDYLRGHSITVGTIFGE